MESELYYTVCGFTVTASLVDLVDNKSNCLCEVLGRDVGYAIILL